MTLQICADLLTGGDRNDDVHLQRVIHLHTISIQGNRSTSIHNRHVRHGGFLTRLCVLCLGDEDASHQAEQDTRTYWVAHQVSVLGGADAT
jgi:hypothetical protein